MRMSEAEFAACPWREALAEVRRAIAVSERQEALMQRMLREMAARGHEPDAALVRKVAAFRTETARIRAWLDRRRGRRA